MAKDDNPFFDLAGSDIRSIPQSEIEKLIGLFGKRAESLGKSMAEPLSETKKAAPIKSFLAQMLITDPLQNAGTALQDWSHTPRDSTSDRPYTPSPFYGGSPATLNPNTWGPALQTFRTDPRAVDVAGLAQPAGALARTATTKVAKPVARAAGEAMAQRMLSGESMIPGLPQSVAPNPLAFAVKPKGGNWAPSFSGKQDSVLRALRPLRRHPQGVEGVAVNRAAGENLWSKIVEGGGQYNPTGWLEMHRPDVYNALLSPEDAALNRWIDKKLTPYVRNEMGTPDDPIRLAHEQGYTHSPSISNIEAEMGGSWLPQRTFDARVAAGFPDEGFAVNRHAEAGYPEGNLVNARRAEEWETRSDSAIDPNIAEVYQEDIKNARDSSSPSGAWNPTLEMANNNPWIEKLSPETPIYKIADEQTFSSDLDFNHLMDELRNAVRPDSDLPENLRLTPKQLDKVTVDQAVKRVNDISDWRIKEKSAVLRDNAATFTHKEYPDTGYKWVELKLPESVEDGTKSLEEALKHEGNVMGHCVGGYCPDVASGQSRIYSLRDPEGKAHVTIEVQPTLQTVEGGKFGDIWDDVINRVSDEEYGALQDEHPDDDLYEAFRSLHGRYVDDSNETIESILREFSPDKADQFLAELENKKPTIVQIRGKGNARPIADYAPYVQDFVRSGEWSAVNEIGNAHLIDVNDYNSVQDALKEISGSKSKSKIPKEYEDKFNDAYEANPKTDQFMTLDQFREFIGLSKPEGYAEGGSVKSDFFLDPSSYAQSRSKQMFPKQKSEWTQQDAARHMLASGMMAQKFGPTVAKIAGMAHEHGNAPVKTIGYMLGIGKMPPDYDQDLHNNALGVQIAKDAKSQEDLESRIQAILNSATKQPTPGQPWIGRPNIPAQMSDYAKGGRVSTNPFDHLV
jgi:hypothetical protein